MALTNSMHTGLAGMKASNQMLDVAGNNIANINTTAFKRSHAEFETQISKRLSSGSAPSGELGGTNPAQLGMGVRLAGIEKDFSSGGVEPTGVNTDMAIEGDGFFVVDQGGTQRYTRNGNFTLDSNYDLVSSAGAKVQGYGVDDDFNIVEGAVQDINIPVGHMTIAEQTTRVDFAGNLNAGGDVATQGSIFQTQALTDAAGNPATAASAMTDLRDATGNPMFNTGDVVTLTGATRGGATLPDKTFEVGAVDTTDSDAVGQTMGDFMSFLDNTMGIDETVNGGVSLDASTGALTIEGNIGTANALEIGDGAVTVNSGTTPTAPFDFTQTQEADGESVRTTFTTYNSLGEPMNLDMSMVLENKDSSGTQWRFYTQAEADTDLDRALSTGTLSFDTSGQLVGGVNTEATVDLANTGAATPQQIDLRFGEQFSSLTALYDTSSTLTPTDQNGFERGTLEDFSVSENGTIVGSFSNALTRNLGRIPVATFANNGGLEEVAGSLYAPGPNSGEARIGRAADAGAGRVVGSALEKSNVDLSAEFIDLISASTGFSANSRVITTSEQMVQQLLSTAR